MRRRGTPPARALLARLRAFALAAALALALARCAGGLSLPTVLPSRSGVTPVLFKAERGAPGANVEGVSGGASGRGGAGGGARARRGGEGAGDAVDLGPVAFAGSGARSVLAYGHAAITRRWGAGAGGVDGAGGAPARERVLVAWMCGEGYIPRCDARWRRAARSALADDAAVLGTLADQFALETLFVAGAPPPGAAARAALAAERDAHGDVLTVSAPVAGAGADRPAARVASLVTYVTRFWPARHAFVVKADCGVLVRPAPLLKAARDAARAAGSGARLLAAKCMEPVRRASDVVLADSACYAALGAQAYTPGKEARGTSRGKTKRVAASPKRDSWAVSLLSPSAPPAVEEVIAAAAANGTGRKARFAGVDPSAYMLGSELVRVLAEAVAPRHVGTSEVASTALPEVLARSEAALLAHVLPDAVSARAMLRGCAGPRCTPEQTQWCSASDGSADSLAFVSELGAHALDGVARAVRSLGKLCFEECYAAANELARGAQAVRALLASRTPILPGTAPAIMPAAGGSNEADDGSALSVAAAVAAACGPIRARGEGVAELALNAASASAEGSGRGIPALLISLDGERSTGAEARLLARHGKVLRVPALDARNAVAAELDAAAAGASALVSLGVNSAGEIGCTVSHLRAAAMVVALDLPVALVAEDDASFELVDGSFGGAVAPDLAELPADFAVLQLLVHASCAELVALHSAWLEAGRPNAMEHARDSHHSTGAYLLSQRGARDIVSRFTRGGEETVRALMEWGREGGVSAHESGLSVSGDARALARLSRTVVELPYDLMLGRCASCGGCATADRCVVYSAEHHTGGVYVATPPRMVDTLAVGDSGSIHAKNKAYHLASRDFVLAWASAAMQCDALEAASGTT